MQLNYITTDTIKSLTEDWPKKITENEQSSGKQFKPARAQTLVDLSRIPTTWVSYCPYSFPYYLFMSTYVDDV